MCKILKKFLQRIQSYDDASFENFWKKIINIIFIYLLTPFVLQNFKKFLKPIQIYDVPFLGPKYPNLSWTKFFGTNHYYHFHLPIGPFYWAKFKKKKSLQRIQSYKDATFWSPKWSICPKQSFFWKLLMSLSSTY